MKKAKNLLYLLIGAILIAGCIKVELKDEREIPKFYEIVLVTFTPEGQVAGQATATLPLPPTTQAPTHTATPVPSDTPTSIPTTTPASPTPIPSAMMSMNAWCRQGPGTIYRGISLLTAGESVTPIGRSQDATWWLVQSSGVEESCWASAGVLSLIGDHSGMAIVSAPPTPAHSNQTLATAAPQRPRQKRSQPTQGATPGVTNTPNPYPNPYPYPAP